MTSNTNTAAPTPSERLAAIPEDPMQTPLGWQRYTPDGAISTVQSRYDMMSLLVKTVPETVRKSQRRFISVATKRRIGIDRIVQGLHRSEHQYSLDRQIKQQKNHQADLEMKVTETKNRITMLEAQRQDNAESETARHKEVLDGYDREFKLELEMFAGCIEDQIEEAMELDQTMHPL